MHATPIPRLGGISVFSTFISVLAGYALLFGFQNQSAAVISVIMGAGALIFATGLFDDFQSISPITKVIAQGAAGVALFIIGIRVPPVSVLASHPLLSTGASLILTVSWVLLLSNAFNLIDGLDGLAGGSALISAIAIFLVSLRSGSVFVSVMAVALAGSLCAFLRFNFNPARIFLGDCGSLFLGFMLSALSLAAMPKNNAVVAAAVPVVLFGFPLLDTMLTISRRFLAGQPIFAADREYIHHRLMKLGYSQRQSVIILYGVTTLFSMAGLLMLYARENAVGIVFAAVTVIVFVGVQYLRYPAMAEIVARFRCMVPSTQPIAANIAIRRAIEELTSARDFDSICWTLTSAFERNEFERFDLSFRPMAGADLVLPPSMRRSYSGAYSHEWRRAENLLHGTPYSQFSLALCGTRFQHADLKLYRAASKTPLRFDLNLLMGDFQQILSSAIDNALAALPDQNPPGPRRMPALALAAGATNRLRKPQPVPAFSGLTSAQP